MWTMLIAKLIGSVLLIFASSLITDWIFSGSKWAHKYFAAVPDIWRPMEAGDVRHVESHVIRMSLLMTLLFSVAYLMFYFVMRPGLIFVTPFARGIATGTFLWVLIPLPQLVTQHLFIKYHRAITTMQLAGWFIKLIAAGLIMAYLF